MFRANWPNTSLYVAVKIRIQSNGLPNHCYYSNKAPQQIDIDLTVNWNTRPVKENQYDITTPVSNSVTKARRLTHGAYFYLIPAGLFTWRSLERIK